MALAHHTLSNHLGSGAALTYVWKVQQDDCSKIRVLRSGPHSFLSSFKPFNDTDARYCKQINHLAFDMKLAVTGCNGSVGSRVVLAALSQGHTVLGIDSAAKAPDILTQLPGEQAARFAFHEADLRDYEVAMRLLRGCEGVVHLAAIRSPGDYHVDTHNT